MTPEPENFEALQRLLKFKRHEQPPPGYFNDFSHQVIAQIRAGSARDGEHVFDRLSWEVPWLQRLIESFQAKPALAMGFGAAMCALLVGGVIYSESTEFNPSPVMPKVEALGNPQATPPASALALGGLDEGLLKPVSTNSSLNIQPVGSLFDQFAPTPQLVSDPFRGNGN